MMGLEDRIGSLTPGKQADIILIRSDDLNIHPANNPVSAVVFYANASNVDAVFVAGTARKKNGKLVHKDVHSVMDKLAQSGERILANSGA